MDRKHTSFNGLEIPSGGQHVDLSLESQKYDNEHQMAIKWSHVGKHDGR